MTSHCFRLFAAALFLACISGVVAADKKALPIQANANGVYVLPTAAAKLIGKSVQLDQQSGTLQNWGSKNDRADWNVSTEKMGNYDVQVTWSVAANDAPQGYNIEINHHATIRAYTVSTEGKFKSEVVGRIMLPPGVNAVTFFPTSNTRGGLCKLQQIELLPVGNLAVNMPQEPVQMHVPDGFVVEQVAGNPLTVHPMLAAFDDRGRLFVTESTGVNADASVLEQSPPHEIRMLEDTDGDGKFDKSTVYADKMTIPQGICWYDGSIYCSSPPNFWKLTDTDGDNVADKREVLATGFPFRGMSDDMHGGTVGRDGRIYLASGRFQQNIRRPGEKPLREGHNPLIVRCRPDGSELEIFCGAMGNAVGVDFMDNGDCFGSGTFGVQESGKRDCLDHFIEGGAYTVLNQPVVDHKMTGGLLPSLAKFGVSASSDLMVYRDQAFGPGYRDNLFSAMFNLHKVDRHILEPDGATYRCRNEDFLTSENPDFHPTDVLEDADGSLLVVDTGAWFLIGCPTSVIAKPQISGGIYRVRRAGTKQVNDPWGKTIAWASLKSEAIVPLLDDPRFAVRDRAMAELAAKKQAAVPVLKAALTDQSSPRMRINAIWALSRIDSPEAAAAARQGLADADDHVRQVAATVAGLFRDRQALNGLSQIVVSDKSPTVRREAAGALGRIGNTAAVPALLSSLAGVTDRFLDHSIIFALIRLDDRQQTVAGLGHANPEIRRGALIALDQMVHGELSQDDVTRALETDNARVQRAALEVISRHSGWANQITKLSSQWLADPKLSDDRRAALRGVLLAFAKDTAVQKLIGQTLGGDNTPQWTKLLLLDVIGRSELAELPANWEAAVLGVLKSKDTESVRAAVTAISAINQSLDPQLAIGQIELLELAREKRHPSDLRVAAAAAALRPGQPIPNDIFDMLCQQCKAEVEPVTRLAAANAIGSARLDDAQRSRTLELLAAAGPLEISALLRPFETADLNAIGAQLIRSLEKSPGVSALPGDRIVKLVEKLPADVRSGADSLLQRVNVDLQAQRKRLDELKDALTGGDAERGKALFFGNKASCSACHRIGEAGGNIGPNLAGIGEIRTRRDLLEAVAFPSASFARTFEPFNVQTTGGHSFSGIISRTNKDAIYLINSERIEVRIPRSEIEEDGITPGKVSIMPQGLDRLLQLEELRDLLAFLSSQRGQK